MYNDMFGFGFEVGDKIRFPTSGAMDDGIVHSKKNNSIYVMNSSGYKKQKDAWFCINLTKIKIFLPELSLIK